jgi:redox-sensitive bicupin YhaK (pirin superfamily)
MALHLARNLVSTADQELFIRRAEERAFVDQNWLKSYYTFSFGDYYDLRFMGFRKLRVLNEDRLPAGEGFPPHMHKNMEVLSYVIEGGLAHKDNVEGAGIVNLIRPGELQRMSAGAGIRHSEFNASEHEAVHFLQIWIEPDTLDIEPGYEQGKFVREERVGRLKLIASRDGREGSVVVHQDVSIYSALIERGKSFSFNIHRDRYGWIQVAKGPIRLNGIELKHGDGVAVFGGGPMQVGGSELPDSKNESEMSEILFFDLA